MSEEVQDLFQYILQYKPEVMQLQTPLKPFIPEYVPAIGDIDEFIKVQAWQLTTAAATGSSHNRLIALQIVAHMALQTVAHIRLAGCIRVYHIMGV